jgi:hypothetical protein
MSFGAFILMATLAFNAARIFETAPAGLCIRGKMR